MKVIVLVFLAVLHFQVLSSSSFAQSDIPAPDSTDSVAGEFDTLQVISNGSGNAQLDSKTRMEPVSIINTAEFRGRSGSLNEIVDKVAGVRVRESGGLGSAGRLLIRGLEGKRVKVFVDGTPFETTNDNFAVDNVPVDFIDHVEVYKGYVPARFGGDGLGGAVNFVGREFNKSCIDYSYSFGSFNTHSAALLAKRNIETLHLELGVSGFYNYSDNDYDFSVPPDEDTVVTRDHDVYEAWGAGILGSCRNYWFDEIGWEFAWYRNYKEIQGIEKDIQEAHTLSQTGSFDFVFKKEDLFVEGLSVEYTPEFMIMRDTMVDTAYKRFVGWREDSIVIEKPKGEVGDGPNLAISTHTCLLQKLMFEYELNKYHSLNWNTVIRKYWYDNKDSLGNAFARINIEGYPGELFSVVSGLSFESELFDRRLLNLLGVKGYHYHSTVTKVFPGLISELTSNTSRQSDVGFDENIRFTVAESFFVKFGYQHSLRFPDSDELFGDGVYITPGIELEPEQADNFYTGIIFDKFDLFFIDHIQYELNGFLMMIDDMIVLKWNGNSGAAYYNLSAATIQGFDMELKIDFNEHLYCWGNMTLQDSRCTRSSEVGQVGKPVPNIPSFYADFGMELFKSGLFIHHGAGKIFFDGSFTDEYYYNGKFTDRDKSCLIPECFTMNAGMEYSLFDTRLSFCAEVRNITDVKRYDLYKKPLSGRSFAVKIRGSLIK